jgi:hypothetical protein
MIQDTEAPNLRLAGGRDLEARAAQLREAFQDDLQTVADRFGPELEKAGIVQSGDGLKHLSAWMIGKATEMQVDHAQQAGGLSEADAYKHVARIFDDYADALRAIGRKGGEHGG